MNRHDIKYQNTHELIRNEYMKLCKKAGTSRVAVSDICRAADINRGTFYLHYECIERLIADIEEDFARILIDAWSGYQFDKNTEKIIDRVFDSVAAHKDLFYFHFHFSDGSGNRLYEEYAENVFIPQWVKRSSLTPEEAKIVLICLMRGNEGVLEHWINCGFKNRAIHRRLYEQVMEHGLYGLVYRDLDEKLS